MVSSGMLICSFYLKERFRRGAERFQYLNQKYITRDGEHTYNDIFDMVTAFCEKHFLFSDDEKNMKMFAVGSNSIQMAECIEYRTLSFTIRSGAYGIESDMTNRQTQEVKYRRTSDDADIKDFKCLLYVPRDVGELTVFKGILIFQTIASYGVKTVATKKMRDFFADIGLTFEVRSVSIRAFVEKLIGHGALNKIVLIRDRISPDSADNMLISSGREVLSYVKPQLQPTWLQKFLLFFEPAHQAEVYEIDGEVFDDIKIEFKLGSRYRTIGLRYIEKASVVEDIPDSVYQNGHCKDGDLIDYMTETANAYKEKMIFTVKCEE